MTCTCRFSSGWLLKASRQWKNTVSSTVSHHPASHRRLAVWLTGKDALSFLVMFTTCGRLPISLHRSEFSTANTKVHQVPALRSWQLREVSVLDVRVMCRLIYWLSCVTSVYISCSLEQLQCVTISNMNEMKSHCANTVHGHGLG